jgi:UV DNA damage endonuclease
MGLESSPHYKINVHIGSYKPNKEDCIKRFITNFSKLSNSAQNRITIENDDKKDSYTVQDLYEVYKSIKTPIVFDYFHWALNNSGTKLKDDLTLAISTWPIGIKPVVHYSSSCKDNENNSVKVTKHADYIYEKIQTFDLDLDVMIEAHSKELALFKYKELF